MKVLLHFRRKVAHMRQRLILYPLTTSQRHHLFSNSITSIQSLWKVHIYFDLSVNGGWRLSITAVINQLKTFYVESVWRKGQQDY